MDLLRQFPVEIAVERRPGPLSRLLNYLDKNDKKSALATVNLANKQYRDPVQFIPDTIAVYRKNNKKEEIEALLKRCKREAATGFYERCLKAAGRN